MKKYSKILVYQYGKVGSTALRTQNGDGKYYPDVANEYKEFVIQTHNHQVAKDVLEKYENILIVNVVRLPINWALSSYWENIHRKIPNYLEMSLAGILDIVPFYANSLSYLDNWMNMFFNTINIECESFLFDTIKRVPSHFILSNHWIGDWFDTNLRHKVQQMFPTDNYKFTKVTVGKTIKGKREDLLLSSI